MGEIAKDAQTIGDGDHDDPLAGKGFAIVLIEGRRPRGQRAAMDEDEDRKLFANGRWTPDVEVKGILRTVLERLHVPIRMPAFRGIDVREGADDGTRDRLHGTGCESRGVFYAIPWLDVLGLFPAEVADRRGGIGDAGIDFDLAIWALKALNLAIMKRQNLRGLWVFVIVGAESNGTWLGEGEHRRIRGKVNKP